MRPFHSPSPAGAKSERIFMPSADGASFISTAGLLIDRFDTTRTTVPQSAWPHGAISTSRLPLAVSQRPAGVASAPAAEQQQRDELTEYGLPFHVASPC